MTLTIELPIEEGELVEKSIDKMATNQCSATQAPDEASSWSALRADAVVAMARAVLSDTPLSATQDRTHSSADHYLVNLHVDSDSLTANQGASQLPVDTIKRLCCDAGIVPIVEGKGGVSRP